MFGDPGSYLIFFFFFNFHRWSPYENSLWVVVYFYPMVLIFRICAGLFRSIGNAQDPFVLAGSALGGGSDLPKPGQQVFPHWGETWWDLYSDALPPGFPSICGWGEGSGAQEDREVSWTRLLFGTGSFSQFFPPIPLIVILFSFLLVHILPLSAMFCI